MDEKVVGVFPCFLGKGRHFLLGHLHCMCFCTDWLGSTGIKWYGLSVVQCFELSARDETSFWGVGGGGWGGGGIGSPTACKVATESTLRYGSTQYDSFDSEYLLEEWLRNCPCCSLIMEKCHYTITEFHLNSKWLWQSSSCSVESFGHKQQQRFHGWADADYDSQMRSRLWECCWLTVTLKWEKVTYLD